MNRKNRKGFTLIELLAVIVILAIITLLAFTKIRDYLIKSDQKSAETNAKIFVKAVNDMASMSMNDDVVYYEGLYTVDDLKETGKLKVNGTMPSDGYVILDDFDVTTACLIIGKYSVEFENGSLKKSTLKGKCLLYEPSDTQEEYAYTGHSERYVAPKAGLYKLEVWGAEGGSQSTTNKGGYGGYSVATITLKENEPIYINVGSQGTTSKTDYDIPGGYNGGGYGTGGDCETYTNRWGSSGGGATSITTVDKLLSELNESSDKGKVLIVAGGGGGGFNISDWVYGTGGNAGGYVGVASTHNSNGPSLLYAGGGTQSAGGAAGNSYSDFSAYGQDYVTLLTGKFGAGGRTGTYGSSCGQGGGGGGGFYGGGGGHQTGGGGGSGYIGNSKLTNKGMFCYGCTPSSDVDTKTTAVTCAESNPTPECAKKGNGYAKITLIDDASTPTGFAKAFPDYTKVEYIESTGTQYIDTGINPNQDTKVELVASTANTDTTSWFGSRNSINVAAFNIWQVSGNFRSDVGTTQKITTAVAVNTRYNIVMDKTSTTINGTKFNHASVDNFSTSSTFTIFTLKAYTAGDYNAANSVDTRMSSLKLYYLKIYDNDTLVRDYIPCYKPGSIGLCDMKSKTFYGNNGSGTFNKGSDVN